MVESQPSKLLVAGSIPVSRSSLRSLMQAGFGWQATEVEGVSWRRTAKPTFGRSREAAKADVAQLAERVLGKDEVTSSILVIGSILRSRADEPDGKLSRAEADVARRLLTDKRQATFKREGTQACRKKNLIVQSHT